MICQKFASILCESACTEHELVDLTFCDQSTNWHDLSRNGLKHVRLSIVNWGYFKIQILQEILKTQNHHHWKSNICADQLNVQEANSLSHSSTESEIISLDADFRMDGFIALDAWDLVIDVLKMAR